MGPECWRNHSWLQKHPFRMLGTISTFSLSSDHQTVLCKHLFYRDPRWINSQGNDSKCYQTHRKRWLMWARSMTNWVVNHRRIRRTTTEWQGCTFGALQAWSARKQEGRSPAHWATSGLLLSSSPLDTGSRKEGAPPPPPVPSPLSTPQVSFPPMVSTEATLWHLVISNNYLGGREPTGTRKGGAHRQNRKGQKYRLRMAGWQDGIGNKTKGFAGGNRGSSHQPSYPSTRCVYQPQIKRKVANSLWPSHSWDF